MDRFATLLVTTATAVLAIAAPAAADQLHTSPSGSDTVCLSVQPCSLETAAGLADGDDTILLSDEGAYTLTTPVTVKDGATVRPAEDVAVRPVVVAGPGTVGPALLVTGGARLADITVATEATGQPAITLQSGRIDRLVAESATGVAIDATATAAGTVIANTRATGDTAIRTSGATGRVEIRNVTASGAGTAIRCTTAPATTALVNTVARGTGADIDGSGSTNGQGYRCLADHVAARPSKSTALSGGPIEPNDPKLADGRPQPGSPLIDGGVDDAANGATDLAGRPRKQGAATDIGAYEVEPAAAPPTTPADDKDKAEGGNPSETKKDEPKRNTPAGEQPATPRADPPTTIPAPVELPPAAPPTIGKSVLIDDAGAGTVRVRIPGTTRFVALSDASALPLGTIIDTTKGSVTLQSALPGGRTQTGTFGGGQFVVRQARSGMTDIVLAGGSYKGCAPVARRASVVATAAAAKGKRRSKVVRKLWAKDKGGRFRTHGSNSVATVRGTSWLTEDRCDGTYTKVTSGAVDVRDKRSGKVTRVRAGRSILVKRR